MKSLKITIIGLLTLFSSHLLAEEMSSISYTRMYSDADGVSHFEDVLMDMTMVELASGEQAAMSNFDVGSSATVMMIEPGAYEDWHGSPNAQLMVVVQGVAEVQVSDGEIRQFGPGDVMIMEDVDPGHTTRTIGDIPHAALMIPLKR